MKKNELLAKIEKLEFDKKSTINIDNDNAELYVIRPSVLPGSLRNEYDVKKNFQIWLNHHYRNFKPNHLRVFIDLNLRVRARPDLKNKLLMAFDNIFYGSDPLEEVRVFDNEQFPHYLNSIKTIACLSQLFLIEQELNYTRESNFDPKNLFYQGWIRQFIDNPKEIDNMCMSVARFQPPTSQYTDKENKKNRRYQPNLKPLWYLKNDGQSTL
ncbi:hypothetical protein MCP_1608 [Methanocella paludicola SANAE]|uniref:Uncharacterized protein n=1 Tax=Methanocella paludicola (strain DSM 17711 / JCM 13418 / NBRC 101707 / SANAE) TaxID=304371 RepID=D1YZ08_METPS|nr:hypothetical protein [Methanocella paludicola]BAI61680.1 hypothetical protein MCP_1608 [Methanocella paludicola SANAE]